MKLNILSIGGVSLAVLWLLHPVSRPPVPRDNVLPQPVLVSDYVPPMSIGGPKTTKGAGTRYRGAANG